MGEATDVDIYDDSDLQPYEKQIPHIYLSLQFL
jgi:hypothetical protein